MGREAPRDGVGGTRMTKLKMLEAITAAVACVLLGVFGAAFVVGCAKKKVSSPQTKSKGAPQTSETKKPKSKLKKASGHSSAHDSTDDVGATSQTKSVIPTSSQYNSAATSAIKPASGYEASAPPGLPPPSPPPPPDEDAFAMNKGEIMQDPGSGDGTANNGSGKTLKRPRRPRGPGHPGRTTGSATRNRKTTVMTTTTAAQNGHTNKSVLGLEEMVKRDAEKMKDEDTLVPQ